MVVFYDFDYRGNNLGLPLETMIRHRSSIFRQPPTKTIFPCWKTVFMMLGLCGQYLAEGFASFGNVDYFDVTSSLINFGRYLSVL